MGRSTIENHPQKDQILQGILAKLQGAKLTYQDIADKTDPPVSMQSICRYANGPVVKGIKLATASQKQTESVIFTELPETATTRAKRSTVR